MGFQGQISGASRSDLHLLPTLLKTTDLLSSNWEVSSPLSALVSQSHHGGRVRLEMSTASLAPLRGALNHICTSIQQSAHPITVFKKISQLRAKERSEIVTSTETTPLTQQPTLFSDIKDPCFPPTCIATKLDFDRTCR